jgi:hypothetical protein
VVTGKPLVSKGHGSHALVVPFTTKLSQKELRRLGAECTWNLTPFVDVDRDWVKSQIAVRFQQQYKKDLAPSQVNLGEPKKLIAGYGRGDLDLMFPFTVQGTQGNFEVNVRSMVLPKWNRTFVHLSTVAPALWTKTGN